MSEDLPPLEKRKMLFELTVSLIAAEASHPNENADSKVYSEFDRVYKRLSDKWNSTLVKNTK